MATDLERLIISIEANTKQFERAIKGLEATTDTGMRGVERSVRSSFERQEGLFRYYGARGGEQFSKEFAKSFGIGREGLAGLAGLLLGDFIKDSIKVAAEAGDQSAKVFVGAWGDVSKQLQIVIGSGLGAAFVGIQDLLTAAGVPGGQLIEDAKTLAETEARRAEIEARRTTVLTKNVQLIEQQVNAMEKADRLDYVKPAAPAAIRLGPLQAPGADELAAFDKVIKNLIFEEQQLGRTAEEQRVYNELKKAGVTLEDQYGGAIAVVARQLHQEELVLQSVKAANDGLEESAKTFIQGLIEGQSAAEAFNAALRKIADTLLDMALHSLFNPGGTPLLQSLFGNVLGLGQFTGGNYQIGGNTGSPSGSSGAAFNTNINVSGSVDQKTLAAMSGMIQRNNVRQQQELQRQWGNHSARWSSLRGP